MLVRKILVVFLGSISLILFLISEEGLQLISQIDFYGFVDLFVVAAVICHYYLVMYLVRYWYYYFFSLGFNSLFLYLFGDVDLDIFFSFSSFILFFSLYKLKVYKSITPYDGIPGKSRNDKIYNIFVLLVFFLFIAIMLS